MMHHQKTLVAGFTFSIGATYSMNTKRKK